MQKILAEAYLFMQIPQALLLIIRLLLIIEQE